MIDLNKNNLTNNNETNSSEYKELIIKLLEENKEFKSVLIDQQKQIGDLLPKLGNNNISNIFIIIADNIKNEPKGTFF